MDNNFIKMLLQGGQGGMAPMFSNMSSGFKTDDQGRISFDPITDKKIKAKNRRKLKNFLQNPRNIRAGSNLNYNVPQFQSAAQGGLGSNLAAILGGAL